MENNNVIAWSKDYFLNWSDFKAESNSSAFEDSSSYIKYHQTWTLSSEISEGETYFQIKDIQLSTQFLKHLSWVREKQSSAELLKHEQGHFDLAELYRPIFTEEIQNKFNEKKFLAYGKNDEQRKQFARKDSSLMIAKELEKWSFDLSQKREKYDEDTKFGLNAKKQKEHDEKFYELRKRN